jgi:hypothetical protein
MKPVAEYRRCPDCRRGLLFDEVLCHMCAKEDVDEREKHKHKQR